MKWVGILSLSFFVILSLACFRLTRLLVFDRITSFIREPFHDVLEEIDENGMTQTVIYIKGKGIRGFIGELLSCHWCTGIWCATLLYVGNLLIPMVVEPIIWILAIAGLGSLIEAILEKINQ